MQLPVASRRDFLRQTAAFLAFLQPASALAQESSSPAAPVFTTQNLDYFGPNGACADTGDMKLIDKVKDIAMFPAEGSRTTQTLLRVCGYEFVLHEIYADGFLFVREVKAKGPWSGIVCHDLRASARHGLPAGRSDGSSPPAVCADFLPSRS